MDRRDERKEAIRATNRLNSSFGAPWINVNPATAANTAGILIIKEMRNASSPE
jgi:hypothetical protein